MAAESFYQVTGLDLTIGEINITRQLELTIDRGQCWCLLGKNGAGKTTLLKTLAGLSPANGEIYLHGQLLSTLTRKKIAQHIGLLFQEHHDAFPATVLETVLAGRHPHLHAWQWESPDDIRLAKQALQFVDLAQFEQRTLETLSGGERRRAGIATLLAQQADLLLLDEPSNHLDLHHRTRLLQRLCDNTRQQQRSLIMVLHDINLAARLTDHCLLMMGDGEIVQGTTENTLNIENLERLYGQPLEQLQGSTGPAWLPK